MKKTILGLAVSAMFMAGAVQAETNANDVSATLNITGTVSKESSCTVNLSQSTVDLAGKLDTIVDQRKKNNPNMSTVSLNITGDSECETFMEQGKIAYKFIGTADNADGVSLANAATGASAATGVGINLYNSNGDIIDINSQLIATSGPTTLGLGLVSLVNQELTTGSVQGSLTIQLERL
ncbi:fimbrial protein [Cronobacter dublinensis]|uniref:fimbrial protein n=1 Tax=Cronobacter dublinensis TaxID=413497 RepID=UPI000CFD17E0|nr:fimbrial protein [Cronobacter dublinensis]